MAVLGTAAQAMLDSIAGNDKIVDQLQQEDPIWETIKAKSKGGKPELVVDGELGAGGSANPIEAFSQAGSQTDPRFVLNYGDDYSTLKLSDKDILAVAGDDSALYDLLERAYKKAKTRIMRSLLTQVYRDGSGYLAQVASVSTATLTLTKKSDAKLFKKGMVLVCSASKTGALLNSGTSGVVQSTDIGAGTVTMTADFSATAAANCFLFRKGDAWAGAGSGPLFFGIEGWVPSTVSGSFYGFDRTTVDRSLVAGNYSDLSASANMYDAVVQAIRFHKDNAPSDVGCKMFITPSTWQALSDQLVSLNIGNFNRTPGEFGHEKMKGFISGMSVEIAASNFCLADQAVILSEGALELWHLGSQPITPLQAGDATELRRVNAEYDAGLRAYCVLAPVQPSGISRVLLPVAA